jgi:replication-associated recombination protein RarA
LAMSLYKVTTVNGHLLPEVVSALQKCIRRGQVDDTLYWAVDLYMTGYDEYAWKRLRIMASEDVGPAEPNQPATIAALYATYSDLKKKKDEAHAPQRLQFVHAVILLATARKNRVVDHALVHHFGNHAVLKRDIPEYALDKHTARGKRMGRGAAHFFAEGIKLENVSGDDPYRELARQTLTAGTVIESTAGDAEARLF